MPSTFLLHMVIYMYITIYDDNIGNKIIRSHGWASVFGSFICDFPMLHIELTYHFLRVYPAFNPSLECVERKKQGKKHQSYFAYIISMLECVSSNIRFMSALNFVITVWSHTWSHCSIILSCMLSGIKTNIDAYSQTIMVCTNHIVYYPFTQPPSRYFFSPCLFLWLPQPQCGLATLTLVWLPSVWFDGAFGGFILFRSFRLMPLRDWIQISRESLVWFPSHSVIACRLS